MREQLSQSAKNLDKRFGIDKRVTALIASLAALTTVNAAAVASRSDKDSRSSRTVERVDQDYPAARIRQQMVAVMEAAQKRANDRISYVNALAAKVPAATYAAALLTSPSDLVKAEHHIIAMGLPPVPVASAVDLAKPFKISYSEIQKKEAATVIERWIDLTQSSKITVDLDSSTGDVFETFTSDQEASTRARIAGVMDSEMARNVREVPAGSNLGPRIDYYLGYHLLQPEQPVGQKWCGAYVSTVYMQSGISFNGGHKYAANAPDYLLTRAAEPDNPAENPRIPSVSDWFKDNAYHFMNGERTPAAGDAVFMRDFTSQGRPYWHTGLVREVTADGTLITHEGNVDNALIRREYPNYKQDEYIYSFGSLFPSEQTPQDVHLSPIVELLSESEPVPMPTAQPPLAEIPAPPEISPLPIEVNN